MTRDPLATAARELLDALGPTTTGWPDARTVKAAWALREVLAHHETHRSREVHPLALAYLEADAAYQSRMVPGDYERVCAALDAWKKHTPPCPIYAAPDPHAAQHEADAALGRALREARTKWAGRRSDLIARKYKGETLNDAQLAEVDNLTANLEVIAGIIAPLPWASLETLEAAAPARRDGGGG